MYIYFLTNRTTDRLTDRQKSNQKKIPFAPNKMPLRVDDSQLSSSLIGRQSCYEPSGNCYQELSLDNPVTNPRVTVTKVYSLFRQFCHKSPGTVTRTTSFLDYLVKNHRTCFKISSTLDKLLRTFR